MGIADQFVKARKEGQIKPMTNKTLREINKRRTTKWCKILNESFCTPAIMLSVNHSTEHLGRLELLTVENISTEEIKTLLRNTLSQLDHGS